MLIEIITLLIAVASKVSDFLPLSLPFPLPLLLVFCLPKSINSNKAKETILASEVVYAPQLILTS